jgi:hypothetical protein
MTNLSRQPHTSVSDLDSFFSLFDHDHNEEKLYWKSQYHDLGNAMSAAS